MSYCLEFSYKVSWQYSIKGGRGHGLLEGFDLVSNTSVVYGGPPVEVRGMDWLREELQHDDQVGGWRNCLVSDYEA